MALKPKDIGYIVGIALTFILGIGNLIYTARSGRRTHFINTVTSQRVRWIEKLRSDIAEYCAVISLLGFGHSTPESEVELVERFYRVTRVVRLRINPAAQPDSTIENLMNEIREELQGDRRATTLSALLEELTTETQLLLKAEWEKIKDEAESGRLKSSRRLTRAA